MWSDNATKFMDNIEGFYKEVDKIKEDMQWLSSNLVFKHSEASSSKSKHMSWAHWGFFSYWLRMIS